MFLLIFGILGIAIINFAPTDYSRYVESVLFILYLWKVYNNKSQLIINLGSVFAVGQILITLANAQLVGFTLLDLNPGMYNYIIPEYIRESLMIRFVGSTSFLLGYHMLTKENGSIENEVKENKFRALFIIGILLIFNYRFVGLTLPGAFGSLLEFSPLAIITFMARMAYIKEDTSLRIMTLIMVGFMVVNAFLFALLREEMALPIVSYFLGIFLVHPRFKYFISVRFVPFYAAAVVFILFFMAFQQIRSSTHGTDRLKAVLEAQEDYIEENDEVEQGAFQRSADLAQITNCVDLKVNNKMQQGETLAVLAVALVPRFLWPAKPKIALGVWFALRIGKAVPTAEGWYNTSINMTVPGHLWLELGYIGLIIGMLSIGSFFKLIWLSCGSMLNPRNFTGTLLGCYMLLTALTGLGADLQLVVTFIALVLITLVVSVTVRQFSS